MDRVRWSEKAISFRSLVNDSAIIKPTLVQIGNKAIVVGEKIHGEFIMASPCKVVGDRFDIVQEELILSSKHSGIWRVISKAMSTADSYIHRLSTKDLERVHRQDIANERSSPRSYVCIREVEAFELIERHQDDTIYNGHRIDRRVKQMEENVEFEIIDIGEVEYTPAEGERTSQDYIMVPKSKQGTLLQLLLPGVMEHETLLHNRVVRVLHCRTKNESRKRHFLLEVNELPCEIRPIASEGSTELRYLHSTQNLYDYMLSYGSDTILFVKLLRGDAPLKAVEFDGYMVLKSTLSGDRIPICRVEDLEITLVNADLPVRVRMPARNEHTWRSLSEVRAAEVQCIQLSLALLARHESEIYVNADTKKSAQPYAESGYNQDLQSTRSQPSSESVRKHFEECERVFGNANNKNTTNHHHHRQHRVRDSAAPLHNVTGPYRPGEPSAKSLPLTNTNGLTRPKQTGIRKPSPRPTDEFNNVMSNSSRRNFDSNNQRFDRKTTLQSSMDQNDASNRFRRTIIK